MLNEQQLKDALTFQTYKAMQYELLSAKLEDQTKRMVEALGLAKKQLDEQAEILQRPDAEPELRNEIDTLRESNAELAAQIIELGRFNTLHAEALRAIAFVSSDNTIMKAADIAREALLPEPVKHNTAQP